MLVSLAPNHLHLSLSISSETLAVRYHQLHLCMESKRIHYFLVGFVVTIHNIEIGREKAILRNNNKIFYPKFFPVVILGRIQQPFYRLELSFLPQWFCLVQLWYFFAFSAYLLLCEKKKKKQKNHLTNSF